MVTMTDVRCLTWKFRSYHAPEFDLTSRSEKERTAALLELVPNPRVPYPRIHPLTKLVSTVLKVPISTVDFIYENKTHIASSSMPNDALTRVNSTPRRYAFCNWILLPIRHETLVAEDTLLDARSAGNPYVCRLPKVRFYLGVPLLSPSGHRIGVLCAMGMKPRKVSAEEIAFLCNVSELIVENLANRPAAHCRTIVDVRTFRVLYSNASGHRIRSIAQETALFAETGDLLFERFAVPTPEKCMAAHRTSARVRDTFEIACTHAESGRPVRLVFWHASSPRFAHTIDAHPCDPESTSTTTSIDHIYFVDIRPELPLAPTLVRQPSTKTIVSPTLPGLRIVGLLAKGDRSIIYHGYYNTTNGDDDETRVAIKVFRTKDGVSMKTLDAATGLKHGSLVQIRAHATVVTPVGNETDTVIVMDLCDHNLYTHVERGKFRLHETFSDDVPKRKYVLSVAMNIARGIKFLHDNEIVHGNLTGATVLFDERSEDATCRCKLSGYGTRHLVATTTPLDLAYAPPEFVSLGKITKAMDVYAFGVLMYELYTSQRPWVGTHKTDKERRLEFPRGTPKRYVELAQRCTNEQEHQRPTIDHVLFDLIALNASPEFDDKNKPRKTTVYGRRPL